MAGLLSRKFGFFHLIALIAAVCLVPLFVNAYMQSSTATNTSLTPSSATITLGDTVTFTATVTATTGTATGLVTFFDGSMPLGSGTLNQGTPNQATFATSLLSASASPHSITAKYQGDATHDRSSGSTSETVNARTSTTSPLVLNPSTVVVDQSSTATITLTDSGSVPPGTADVFAATTGAPVTGRASAIAILFADGQVLVAGGLSGDGTTVLDTAEIYSASSSTFAATAGNMHSRRLGAVAVLLPNGKVLVAGGSVDISADGALNTAELFDPIAGTFTLAGANSTPANQMKAARFRGMAALLNNGKVLLAGGLDGTGTGLASAELYDPVADTFTATGSMNTARTGATATLLGNGKVLIAGGATAGGPGAALASAELFDPNGNSGTGSFTSVAGANPNLSDKRFEPEAALLLSGKVLIVGGQNQPTGTPLTADLYDPVTDSFTATAHQMFQDRFEGSAVTLPNGMVLLAGGGNQIVELYDPEGDKFDTTGNLLHSDQNASVATLLNNGQVLLVGLSGIAPTATADAELYTPSFNPLGSVGVTSSEATDSITGLCVLTPSTSTASTCTANVTPVNIATSPHTITGTYPADAVHSGSNNTASLTVNKADTTTTVTSSANPSVFGQSVTFTATVSPTAPGAPTGTVTFLDGGSPIGTGTLSGGVATFATSALAIGNHTITTSYGGDGNFNGSTGSLTGNPQVVNKADTSTTVTSSVNPSVFGQSVTFTATVSPVAPGAGTPTGTVTFLDGGSPIGTGTLSGGIATFATSALTIGNHTITTSYGGDGNFNGSTGSLTGNPQVVNKADTTTTVTSSVNPSVFGQSVTFTATVSPVAPGAGTPTGTVVFLDGGNPIGTGTLSGGVATFATSALAVGNHTITSHYGGDGNFNGNNGSLTGNPQVVNKADTSTTVTSSVNPSVFGQSVTFTTTVSAVAPGAGTPTGTVTFLDGGSPIGTGTLSGGVATFATSALTVGSHTITTSYGGDGNFNGSTGSLTGNPQVVNKTNTSTSVTSSVNPSVFGQSVTFTATVSAVAPGSGTPTGTVTFLDGGSPIGTGTLSGGIATFATSALTIGNHTITTSYGGDGNFNGSTGSLTGNPQVVNKADTSTIVTPSVNPSVFGQSVTFTATVSAVAPGTGTPTGTVTFLDGGSPIGTGTLSGGIATFTTSALTVGNHTVTTSYGGDGTFNGSTGSLTGNPQVVNKADTSTTVTSSVNPSVFGQSVIFTATVSAVAPGSGTPTGTVTFLDGGSPIGTGTLSGGIATFTTSALTVGNHTITTSYGGDGNFNGSTGSLTANPQVVNKANTSTSVTSSANPSVFGQSVTFTATVSAVAPGAGTPTGTVTFLDGGSPIGTGTLSSGVATFATSALAVGNHTITTSYGGDGNFNGSTGSLTANPQVVNKADTSTTVTSSVNPSVFGQSVTFTATVSAVAPGVGTPTGTVTFFDGGSPIGTGTLSGGVATFTTSALAVGSHTITTSYGGDGNFNGSTGSLTGNPQVVNKDNTTTTITANTPNPSKVNQAVSISATVTANAPGSGTPIGTVTVSDGAGETCTITLSSGAGSCSLTPQVAGTDTLTAHYNGDASFNTSTSAGVSQTVNTRHTTTTVALNPSTVVVNKQSTVTVTVTDDDASGTAEPPTGMVTVTSDSGGDGTPDTIVGSPCTLTPSTTSVSTCQVTVRPHGKGSGTHTITASYPGTNVHSASTGSAMLTIKTRHTSTAVSLNLPSVVVNQTSTATVTVTDDDSDTVDKLSPTGTVTVTSDSGGDALTDTITGTCTLGATTTGVSTCQVTVKPHGKGSGTHKITASYPGSDVHSASDNSPGTPLTVGTRHTKIAVGFSINPVKISTQLTVTTTVTDDDPNGSPLPPAGTINLSSNVGSDSLGSPTCVLSGSGAATTCTITLVAPHVSGGPHTIGAIFAQDDQHTGSNTVPANSALTVQPADTATVIPSATSLVQFVQNFVGQQVTFTATVTNSDPNSNAAPVGTFQFLVDGNSIGTATVIPNNATVNSSATFTATLAQIGQAQNSPVSHSITAKFIPNADFVTSTSTDSIAITETPLITNIPGQTIPPVSLQLNGVGTTGNLNFQCNVQLLNSNIPPSVQSNFPLCKITPTSGSLPATVTATLTTIAVSSSRVNSAPSIYASNSAMPGFYALSTPLASVLGLLLLGGRRRKSWSRRKLLSLLGMMLLLAILGIAVGCGGGFGNSNNLQPLTNGTQQGTYVVSVTGTDSNGNVVAIATIPLTVQL